MLVRIKLLFVKQFLHGMTTGRRFWHQNSKRHFHAVTNCSQITDGQPTEFADFCSRRLFYVACTHFFHSKSITQSKSSNEKTKYFEAEVFSSPRFVSKHTGTISITTVKMIGRNHFRTCTTSRDWYVFLILFQVKLA